MFESAEHLMVCAESKVRQLSSSVLQSVQKHVGKRHVWLQVSCRKGLEICILRTQTDMN